MIQLVADSLDRVRALPRVPGGAPQGRYTTNPIESPERPLPPSRPTPRPLPHEQAALKVLYLVATPRRKNRETDRRFNSWKSILNTLTVHYGEGSPT